MAHQSNILVMGPGGYRFGDYVKVGLPLDILVFVIALLILPLLWPWP
jgi:di/tricarboxylate transporter